MKGTLPLLDTSLAATRPATSVSVVEPHMRQGEPPDAPGIFALIEANLVTGHLLPRSLDDIAARASRFVVIEEGARLIGCAELAPLSRAVAEVRSLVIDEAWRGRGLGTALVEELGNHARASGFSVLCAFTHDASHFVGLGFSMVPHVWFPEKVTLDCTGCARFPTCGQHAMALALTGAGVLPLPHRLREPYVSRGAADTKRAALPPVRLRVIA